MDDSADILINAVERMFREYRDSWEGCDAGSWPAQTWAAVEEMGLPLALMDEASGGFGLSCADALRIVRQAGSAAVPLPIGEAMLGTSLLARAGVQPPDGASTIALAGNLTLSAQGGGYHLRGRASRVPWGRLANWVVLLAELCDETGVILVPSAALNWSAGKNLAGEPRDSLQADLDVAANCVGAIPRFDATAQRSLGAALRCQGLAGAIEVVLAMTVQYAQDRVQFGRKIGSFQAIQHALAVAAGHSVACTAAADWAAEAFMAPDPLPIAMAKIRCGEAAGAVAAIAHQIHGALGFSAEHALQRYTKRLWAWREEYGSEAVWSELVGRAVLKGGADALWPALARL